jgi:medium-chain acyl-[acyl-carrier-protein] hydrolase
MLLEPFKVLASDSDFSQKLKVSSLMRICEEISIKDTTRLHMGRDKTLDKGLLWVISRISFNFASVPQYDSLTNLITYPEKREHFFFPRFYVLKDLLGRTLIEGEAIWILMDAKTRKPVNPTEHGIIIRSFPFRKETDVSLSIPLLPLSGTSEKIVSTSDLDLNGHMNNTKYADLFFDQFPTSFYAQKELSSFRINFYQEAVEGEKIVLQRGINDLDISLTGSTSKGKVFDAYAKYKKTV